MSELLCVTRNNRSVRRAEMTQLIQSLESLKRGRGKIIEIVGEPGIGKTRLLTALADEAADREIRVRSYLFTEARGDLPADLIGGLADRTASAEPCSVVILDDFHWADDAAVMAIEELIHRPPEAPLLLVIAQRPRQASLRLRGFLARGAELGTVNRLSIGPLTRTQSAELLGLAEDDDALDDLYRASHGIPLYLMALAGIGPGGQMPDQAAMLMLSEAGMLDDTEFLVLTSAAVLDRECDVPMLAAVVGCTEARVHDIVAALVRRDLIRAVGDTARFAFRHPVLRTVVYQNVCPGWAPLAHRRAADFLERRGMPATQIAAHLEHCLDDARPTDVRILRGAAVESLMLDPAASVRWLQAALRFARHEGDDGQTRKLLRMLSRPLGLAGRLTESRDLFHQIAPDLPPGPGGCHPDAIAFFALMEGLLGNYAEAQGLLHAELTALSAVEDPPLGMVGLIIEEGILSMLQGTCPESCKVSLAKQLARRHGDTVSEAGALSLSALCSLLNMDICQASQELTASAALADQLTDTAFAPHPEYLGFIAWAEILMSRHGDAQRHFQRAISISRGCGHTPVLPVLLIGLAKAHLDAGRPAQARRTAAEGRALAEANRSADLVGVALAVESLGAAWTGDYDDAMALGEAAVMRLQNSRFPGKAIASIVLAVSAMLVGDYRRCAALILDAGGGAGLPDFPAVLRPSCFATLAASSMESADAVRDMVPEDADRAVSWATRAEEATRGIDLLSFRASALIARASEMRAAGEAREALPLYRDAALIFSRAGMPQSQAWILTAAASCSMAAGLTDEAESLLLLAGELARRCGAIAIEVQVQRLQLQLWPMRSQPTALLSRLTSREREVAELAGHGMRTRDIAAKLSLSPRTVDVHLTRIYHKLNISSRTMLARVILESQDRFSSPSSSPARPAWHRRPGLANGTRT
jgi:DNA-binding CsgD family transcriptional regulator